MFRQFLKMKIRRLLSVIMIMCRCSGACFVSGLIREKRRKRGAIDFDFPEAKIVLDEKGIPDRYPLKKQTVQQGSLKISCFRQMKLLRRNTARPGFLSCTAYMRIPILKKIEELLAFVRKQGVKIEKEAAENNAEGNPAGAGTH